MDAQLEATEFLRERGIGSAIHFARTFGATVAGVEAIQRSAPWLSAEAASIVLGHGLRSIQGANQLGSSGSIGSNTYRDLPTAFGGRAVAATARVIVRIDLPNESTPRWLTVDIPTGANVDPEEIAEIIFEAAESLLERYGPPLEDAILSYDIVGAYR